MRRAAMFLVWTVIAAGTFLVTGIPGAMIAAIAGATVGVQEWRHRRRSADR